VYNDDLFAVCYCYGVLVEDDKAANGDNECRDAGGSCGSALVVTSTLETVYVQYDVNVDVDVGRVDIGCDGRGLCLLMLHLLGGLGYKINSINTGLFSYPKSPIDSFGVNLLQWCENRSRRIL